MKYPKYKCYIYDSPEGPFYIILEKNAWWKWYVMSKREFNGEKTGIWLELPDFVKGDNMEIAYILKRK